MFFFFSAEELRAGLDVPRLEQLEQAKLFSDCAEKTLRILEVRSQDAAPSLSERLPVLTRYFCAGEAAVDRDRTSPQTDQFLMLVRRSRCLLSG